MSIYATYSAVEWVDPFDPSSNIIYPVRASDTDHHCIECHWTDLCHIFQVCMTIVTMVKSKIQHELKSQVLMEICHEVTRLANLMLCTMAPLDIIMPLAMLTNCIHRYKCFSQVQNNPFMAQNLINNQNGI